MTIAAQMLKQIRRTLTEVIRTTEPGELRSQLEATDIILNVLGLHESPDFYTQHIDHGRTLLADGVRIVNELGSASTSPGLTNPAIIAFEDSQTGKTIEELNLALVSVVECLDEGRSKREKEYLIRLAEWESGFHSHYLEQAGRLDPAGEGRLTRENLELYLRDKYPEWGDVVVTSFTRLNGGFSKITILFGTLDSVNGPQEMVIRAEQAVDLQCYEGCKVPQEYNMIELMRTAGLPIARPLWLESDASKLGCRFIVSRRAPGKTFGGALGSDDALSDSQLTSIIDTIVEMHNVVVDPTDRLAQESHLREWLPCHTISDALSHYVNVFLPRVREIARVAASPQLARGLKWLSANVPVVLEAPVVVHNDFSLNNLMLYEGHVSAVLDWESSHLGDPAEDIIWTQQNLGSYIPMDEFLEIYHARTGRVISAYRLAYARVAKCAADSLVCMSAMSAFNTNDSANIKLATLAYKYLGIFGTQFNVLIEAAEQAKARSH